MPAVAVRPIFAKKNLGIPDEVRTLPKTKLEFITVGEYTLMRVTFQPGWKWSEDIGPSVGERWCPWSHVIYVISGRIKTVLEDGTELLGEPGDLALLPPGHDAWVLGDEPFVALDLVGSKDYGTKPE